MTEWLTPAQAADRLPRLSEVWFRRECRKGSLRASRVGGKWLIPTDAIDELLEGASNSVKTRKRRRRSA